MLWLKWNCNEASHFIFRLHDGRSVIWFRFDTMLISHQLFFNRFTIIFCKLLWRTVKKLCNILSSCSNKTGLFAVLLDERRWIMLTHYNSPSNMVQKDYSFSLNTPKNLWMLPSELCKWHSAWFISSSLVRDMHKFNLCVFLSKENGETG